MANPKRAIPDNVAGRFFVDDACINCGVSRHYAPEIYGDNGTYAFVMHQPVNAQEEIAASQALLACPVAAIGTRDRHDSGNAIATFPLQMAPSIYINGFNHRKSFGAHSYFIQAKGGNWLIDSPRFIAHLVDRFQAMGGIRYVFLSHSDDVGDAHKYAEYFGADRIIHRLDSHAQPNAEIILQGHSDHSIGDARLVMTPGHTAGHMVLVWCGRYLFSGDHLAWLPRQQRFGGFRDYCWYSWEEQIRSVSKLRCFRDIERIFPGHGKWGRVESGTFPDVVDEVVSWMQTFD